MRTRAVTNGFAVLRTCNESATPARALERESDGSPRFDERSVGSGSGLRCSSSTARFVSSSLPDGAHPFDSRHRPASDYRTRPPIAGSRPVAVADQDAVGRLGKRARRGPGHRAGVVGVRHHKSMRAVPPAEPKVTVTTVTARTGDIGVHLEAIGTVTPVHTASITSQVNGLVVAVHYTEGQRVNESGAILLVDIDFLAALPRPRFCKRKGRSSGIKICSPRRRWTSSVTAPPGPATLSPSRPWMTRKSSCSRPRARSRTTRGRCNMTRFRSRTAISPHPSLAASACGSSTPATSFSWSSGSVTLAVITQIEPITVVFTISEDNLSAVRERLQQGAQLAVEALDRSAQKKLATGTLLTIDNQIDTTTGTVREGALHVFDNRDVRALSEPDSCGNARLLVDTHRGVTLVPASAIQQNGSESFVYVIQDDVAHTRRVTLDVADNGLTQVEGISPGDVLANSAFDRLHDNAKVVASGPPSATPSASVPPAPGGSAAP